MDKNAVVVEQDNSNKSNIIQDNKENNNTITIESDNKDDVITITTKEQKKESNALKKSLKKAKALSFSCDGLNYVTIYVLQK